MKIIKRFSLLAVIVLTVFAFVGCGEYQVLNDLGTVTDNISNTTKDLTNFDASDLGNSLVSLSYNDNTSVMLLSDSDEMTPLQTFIELRKELISVHSDILLERTDLLALRIQIKDAVDYIKTNQIMLLDDDKATIQESITTLKSLRDSLLETKGQAYQRLVDLRGTYTRDNLDNINQVYTEVIPVLKTRLDLFQQAQTELETIYNILNDYTE